MNYFIRNRYILLLLLIGGSITAQGRDRYWPEEVLSIEKAGPLTKVTYHQSCGSEFFGAILRPKADEQSLLVGVLSSRSDARCTGMPQKKIVYLRTIDPKWTLAPLSFSQTQNSRVEIDPVSILSHHVRVVQNKKTTEIAFLKKCKTPDYLVLREEGTQLHLGLLDIKLRKAKPNVQCGPDKVVATKVPFLRVEKINSISRLEISKRPHDNVTSYEVKLARVRKLTRQSSSTTATFYRNCDEVGIGIALGTKKPRRTIAVVLSKFPSVRCNHSKRIRSSITVKNLSLHSRQKFIPMRILNKSSLLSLDSAKIAPRSKSVLELNYVRSCERPVGAVFSNDRFDHVSTGILLAKQIGKICKQPFHQDSMKVRSSIFTQKNHVYPLTVAPSFPEAMSKVQGHSLLLPGWTKS